MEIVPTVLLIVALLAREWVYSMQLREERLINAKQTQDLLQRIQAPEVAVMSHATDEPSEYSGLPLRDDEYEFMG